jgi:hypothetical protein
VSSKDRTRKNFMRRIQRNPFPALSQAAPSVQKTAPPKKNRQAPEKNVAL